MARLLHTLGLSSQGLETDSIMANVAAQRAKGNKRRLVTNVVKQEIDDEADDVTQSQNKKVSLRVAKRADLPGPAGSDNNPKGQVRHDRTGRMYYRKDNNTNWEPAVYHNDIRARLLAETDQLGSYDYPHAKGQGQLDRTSYLASQKSWGFASRQQYPDILHMIFPPDERRGVRAENWYYNGKIVLDLDDHPVKLYTDIPLVCASVMEGGWMESIRRQNPLITHKDFRARMPHFQGVEGYQKPRCGITALSNRQWRFRTLNGCLSWEIREGSDTIRRYMINLYPASCLQVNSFRNFRTLTKKELQEIVQLNKGQFPERARARAETPFDHETGHTGTKIAVPGAGEKRKRNLVSPHHGPGLNAIVKEEDEGETVAVRSLTENHGAQGPLKRARHDHQYRSTRNKNAHDDELQRSARAGQKRKGTIKPLHLQTRADTFMVKEDIGDTIVVGAVIENEGARHRQGYLCNGTQQTSYDGSKYQDVVATHSESCRHQQRSRLDLTAHKKLRYGTEANLSSLHGSFTGHAPCSHRNHNREHSQYYQPNGDQRHQSNLRDDKGDGLSLISQHLSSPYYTARYDNNNQRHLLTQQFVQPINVQKREPYSKAVVKNSYGESKGDQEDETSLSLISPPSSHSSSQYPLSSYNPDDDDPISFQLSPEESILWLSRNQILF